MENNIIDSNVKISEDAISSIIELAINEIEGVSTFEAGIASKLTKRKPIHIDMDEDSISIEASISIIYGTSINETVPKVQENIKNNVEIMTTLTVSNININVLSVLTA